MPRDDKPDALKLHREVERLISSFSSGQPGYTTFLPLLNRCSQIIKGFEERIASGELVVSATGQREAQVRITEAVIEQCAQAVEALTWMSMGSENAAERCVKHIRALKNAAPQVPLGASDEAGNGPKQRGAEGNNPAGAALNAIEKPVDPQSESSAPETAGTWEERCAALYQVIGAMASYSGMFGEDIPGSDDVDRALDVAAGRGDVENLLPWPRALGPWGELEARAARSHARQPVGSNAWFDAHDNPPPVDGSWFIGTWLNANGHRCKARLRYSDIHSKYRQENTCAAVPDFWQPLDTFSATRLPQEEKK